jgi:hypothetical protein
MNVKWQKNAHILIKSQSGDLIVDNDDNIRRACCCGRLWFQIKDWLSGGKKSEQLNRAVEKTLEAVQVELQDIQHSLSEELNKLPNDKHVLDLLDVPDDYTLYPSPEARRTILKIAELIQKLMLIGRNTPWFQSLRVPNYDGDRGECLRDIPQAVRMHSQILARTKNHQGIIDIDNFFTLNFIQDDVKKDGVRMGIDKRDKYIIV